MQSPDFLLLQEYAHGVVAVDSGFGRERMAACYLLEAEKSVAIIETGTNHSVPLLLETLKRRGWQPEQVQYVVVTHVHLDHAGGAGALMAQLPEATLLVHPRGARHMADPGKLEASVRQVYGDEIFERDYGTLVPIPEQRIRAVDDGEHLLLDQRKLIFRDTPGHARHHFCVWDETSRGWFTGDTFGLSYREFDTANGPFIFPTTTPIQFDPDALLQSIDLLLAARPRYMYLTHFGRVAVTERLARQLKNGVHQLLKLADRYREDSERSNELAEAMFTWLIGDLRKHGVEADERRMRALLNTDVVLNTQGIEFWLDHS